MAIYKRTYAAYTGKLTPRWSRFLILTRYSIRGLFQSRIITGLFILSAFLPLFTICALYLNHNAYLLTLLRFKGTNIMSIDGKMFMGLMSFQGAFAFLIAAFIGPGLVSPDLTNNALPVYFCRPLSRTEYVLGRACVILFLLSFVTWIPGVLVFTIQSTLVEGWAGEHMRIVAGILLGSLLWISILALLSLALSAWVRWRLIAGGLLLGVMFGTTGFAGAIGAIMHTTKGMYLDPAALVAVIYINLFDLPTDPGIGTPEACLALLLMGAICVWLLSKKIRAFQVVR